MLNEKRTSKFVFDIVNGVAPVKRLSILSLATFNILRHAACVD